MRFISSSQKAGHSVHLIPLAAVAQRCLGHRSQAPHRRPLLRREPIPAAAAAARPRAPVAEPWPLHR